MNGNPHDSRHDQYDQYDPAPVVEHGTTMAAAATNADIEKLWRQLAKIIYRLEVVEEQLRMRAP